MEPKKTGWNQTQYSNSQFLFLLAVFLTPAVLIFAMCSGVAYVAFRDHKPYVPKESPAVETVAEADPITSQFSDLDGRHIMLAATVKQAMNDPDSFEHIATSYEEKGDRLIVDMAFRGKNAFNAKVVNRVRATITKDGEILSVKEVD